VFEIEHSLDQYKCSTNSRSSNTCTI